MSDIRTEGEDNLVWTSASIVNSGADYVDIAFVSEFGDLHWVIYDDLAGAYQYFVNAALPDLSVFRTLWRLNPDLFLNGRTYLKDEALPDFALYANATKVQDETWELSDGSYITKYDFSDYVRLRDYYGVYGAGVGSWYIHPSTEYFAGSQLSQTLTVSSYSIVQEDLRLTIPKVHRESSTGDSVQLNVVQDTSHFRVAADVHLAEGKTWGPWLWYLNDGSLSDVAARREQELASFPYSFYNDTAYHSRGALSGTLTLSDGRPAADASVFLGDTNTTTRPLVQGANSYHTTQADENGAFSFPSVKTGSYALYAWANGSSIGDVYTNVTLDPISIVQDETNALGNIVWEASGHTQIFQLGTFDKAAGEFKNGGFPYQHGLTDESPANLTFTIGQDEEKEDWYYAQSAIGKWEIEFEISAADLEAYGSGNGSSVSDSSSVALLSISLAGYSQSATMEIDINGVLLDTLDKDTLASDPALYRSGRNSGEWRFFQYEIEAGVLAEGANSVGFNVTRYTQWRGFMWDTVVLEWLD